jgi:hypothetical protein
MEEAIQAELEAVKGMVLTWKKNYLREATSQGDDDFLADDLREEIETYIVPYLRRICQCNYIEPHEADEFLDFCFGQVEDLRASLRS